MIWGPTLTEHYDTWQRSDGHWWYWDKNKAQWHGPYETNGVAILKAKKECGG
jgi:hypothetical protein